MGAAGNKKPKKSKNKKDVPSYLVEETIHETWDVIITKKRENPKIPSSVFP